MPLTFGSAVMILKAAVTFSFEAPPPTSRKFAGSLAVELDDVHRRHGQPGAVDHAADVAVERHIGEIVLGGLDLLLVLLRLVAQLHDVVMAEQRVAVERFTLASSTRSRPSFMTISGLTSSRLMSFSVNAL